MSTAKDIASNIVKQIADHYSERIKSDQWVSVRQETNDKLDKWVTEMIEAYLGEAVSVERILQIASGYTAEHDDKHGAGELMGIAMNYERDGKFVEALAILRASREVFERRLSAVGDE